MTTFPTHAANPENRIIVVRQPVGWEVREERGPLLLRSTMVTDWHRVEWTMQRFKLQPFTPTEQ
ncbi:MAG: hypothetical protein ABIP90_07915 [Vicinamibacterales bacterium]